MSRRGSWRQKKKKKERNNVLDVTEILCLRGKDCRGERSDNSLQFADQSQRIG